MPADRTAIVVLGMQGSGARTFARIAHLLGSDLPDDADAISSFNDRLLASAGSRWDDWLPLNPGWNESPTRADFLVRARELLHAQFGTSPLFVLMDPRICRIAPFWLEALGGIGIRPVVVLPQRDPGEVNRVLAQREGLQEGFGLLLWLRHVLEAEAATRHVPRLFFGHGQLLERWGDVTENLERVANLRFARRSVSVEAEIGNFVAGETRRQQEVRYDLIDVAMPAWVQEAYAILDRWCQAKGRDGDLARLDEIRTAFDAASPSFSRVITKGIGADGELGATEIARTYARARDDLAERMDEAGIDLQQSRAKCAELTDERDRLAQQLEEANANLESVRAEHEAAGQALADLAEANAELERLRSDSVAAAGAHAALMAAETELEKLREQHEIMTQSHAALAEKLSEADEEVVRLRIDFGQLESAMRQRQEEIVQAWAEATAERQGRERADAELRRAIDQNERLFEGFARIEARVGVDAGELAALRDRASDTEQLLATQRREHADALALLGGKDVEIERLRARAARADSELAQLTVLHAKAQAQLNAPADDAAQAEMQREVARRQAELAASQGRSDESRRQSEWLREAMAVLHKQPAWWSLLSSKARRRHEREILETHGLFDSAAYLARNPDVAREGVDPLVHYMSHGLFEGRGW